MCDCFKLKTAEITGRIIDDFRQRKMDIVFLSSGFEHTGFRFGGKLSGEKLFLPFEFVFLKKKEGIAGIRKYKQLVRIIPPYCPFCGEKCYDDILITYSRKI